MVSALSRPVGSVQGRLATSPLRAEVSAVEQRSVFISTVTTTTLGAMAAMGITRGYGGYGFGAYSGGYYDPWFYGGYNGLA